MYEKMFSCGSIQENANKNHDEIWFHTVRLVVGGQNGLRQHQQRILGDTCRLHRTSQLGGQSVAREKEEGVKILRFSTRTTERALVPWTETGKLGAGQIRRLRCEQTLQQSRKELRVLSKRSWDLAPASPQHAAAISPAGCAARLPLRRGAEPSRRTCACLGNFLCFDSFEQCVKFLTF